MGLGVWHNEDGERGGGSRVNVHHQGTKTQRERGAASGSSREVERKQVIVRDRAPLDPPLFLHTVQ